MRRVLYGLILAALATPSFSQEACAPRALLVDNLREKFGETQQSFGVGGGNVIVETFASEAGSWTILVTRPDGISCLVASGQSFTRMSEETGAAL